MSAQAQAVPTPSRRRALRYAGLGALWLVSVLLGIGYVLMGVSKFEPFWIERFVAYGLPAWFTYVVGVVEILGGVALVVPRVAAPGAALLATIMIGATGTHWVHDEMNWSFTLGLTVVLGLIAVARLKINAAKAG